MEAGGTLARPDAAARDEARCRAHAPERRGRRPGLRRQLRRAGRGPRARRERRPGARDRSLRDRRAADLGLRSADGVAAGPGPLRLDPPDLLRPGGPHAPYDGPDDAPWTFSTFDYRELCAQLWEQSDAEFETAKVDGRTGEVIHTDRGDLRAPLVVDALGWRRVLDGAGFQPPDAPLSRGLEVHPWGAGDELEIWIDRGYVPAGYGWSFPARRRGPRRRRLVRSAASREGAHRSARRASSSARPSATRGTRSPTGSARRPPTASSSPATRPGAACRSPPRASGPPSTSASPAAGSSGRWPTARGTREEALRELRLVLGIASLEVRGDAADRSAWSRACSRACWRGCFTGCSASPS